MEDRSLLSPDLIADPHPYFHHLREEDPVHWSEPHRGWLLTRYDDVRAAFRDLRLSSERVSSMLPRISPEEPIEGFEAIRRLLGNWMVFRDPPAHARLRRLGRAAFTMRRVETLRGQVRELVETLLASLAGRATFDLVQDFAFPLPATVIARLLGVPETDIERFGKWSHELEPIVFGGSMATDRRDRAVRSLKELESYFVDLLARRRREPQEDLLSALTLAEEQGDALSADEVVATCILLLFAGHETTTNLIANGFLALERNPRERDHLRDRGVTSAAIDEILRFEGPTKIQVRVALEDLEMRGRTIRAGDRVFLIQAAANRDPDRFTEPDVLDLSREDNEHVGFGYGIHFCLGAPLARLESEVVFGTLPVRLPELRTDTAGPTWRSTILARGIERLPVRLGNPDSGSATANATSPCRTRES